MDISDEAQQLNSGGLGLVPRLDPDWVAQRAKEREEHIQEQETQTERQMRLASLEAALRLSGEPKTAQEVLLSAEAFANFLMNGSKGPPTH